MYWTGSFERYGLRYIDVAAITYLYSYSFSPIQTFSQHDDIVDSWPMIREALRTHQHDDGSDTT